MDHDRLLSTVADEHPYPLVFLTISGAHLYGFPSPDSDYDLRGVHALPAEQVVGLDPGEETVERSEVREGVQLDFVTHDLRKFILLMLRRNGYVLEQLTSPLVVRTSPEHEELKTLARGCITRHHAHHYLGFAQNQWQLLCKDTPPRVKPLLYVYRVLLTGIHLMGTGEVEANLLRLNERFALPYVPDLVARKLAGAEQSVLGEADLEFHRGEYQRLVRMLEQAHEESHLPQQPSTRRELESLLVRVRLG